MAYTERLDPAIDLIRLLFRNLWSKFLSDLSSCSKASERLGGLDHIKASIRSDILATDFFLLLLSSELPDHPEHH